MQTCSRCCKWRLLAGECTVCASLERLKAAASSSRLPSTSEAEAKTTKILDGAYYSLARLFPESDEEAGKGEPSPKKKTAEETPKGEKSPKASDKEEKKRKDTSPEKEVAAKKPKEAQEAVEEKTSKPKVVQVVEEKKSLPKRKEEDRSRRGRSRTPKYQKEKDKRKEKKDSRSKSVSGSIVRKKKREDLISHRKEGEESQSAARPSSGIQREAYLRPRPSRREPRSPRTPDYPPPRAPPVQPGRGRGGEQGKGWRGSVPYSHHPRWTESTNKGITKRAKQELHDRKQYRGHW